MDQKIEKPKRAKTGGRKPGSANLKTRAIADKVAASGKITPLELLIENMLTFRDMAQHALEEVEAIDEHEVRTNPDTAVQVRRRLDDMLKFRVMAGEAAKDAAPYIHPRLTSVDVGNKNDEPFVVKVVSYSDAGNPAA